MTDKTDKMEIIGTEKDRMEQAAARRKEMTRSQVINADIMTLTMMRREFEYLRGLAEATEKEAKEKEALYEKEIETRGPRIREAFIGDLKFIPPEKIEKIASQIMSHGIQLEKRPDKIPNESRHEFEEERQKAHQEKKELLGKITKKDISNLIITITTDTPIKSRFVEKQEPKTLQFELQPNKPETEAPTG